MFTIYVQYVLYRVNTPWSPSKLQSQLHQYCTVTSVADPIGVEGHATITAPPGHASDTFLKVGNVVLPGVPHSHQVPGLLPQRTDVGADDRPRICRQ